MAGLLSDQTIGKEGYKGSSKGAFLTVKWFIAIKTDIRERSVRDRRKVKSEEHSVHRNLRDICACPLTHWSQWSNEYLDRRRTLSSYPVKVDDGSPPTLYSTTGGALYRSIKFYRRLIIHQSPYLSYFFPSVSSLKSIIIICILAEIGNGIAYSFGEDISLWSLRSSFLTRFRSDR